MSAIHRRRHSAASKAFFFHNTNLIREECRAARRVVLPPLLRFFPSSSSSSFIRILSCCRFQCQHLGQTNCRGRFLFHVSMFFSLSYSRPRLFSRLCWVVSPIIYLIRSNSLSNLLHRVYRVIYIVFPPWCLALSGEREGVHHQVG